jgi:cytochrome c-type biogenesis protein CcmH
MLWIALGAMSFAAVVFTIWPLMQSQSKHTLLMVVAVLFVVASSAGLYASIGSPGVDGKAPDTEAASEMADVVHALAKRLESNPADLGGWRMLGRSYMTLGNYQEAARAYEKVIELEPEPQAQSLVELGEAILASSGQTMTPRVSSLFENALALEPNNPAALFWGGIGAINRGDNALAADRWERLLTTNPPPEIRNLVEQRIAEWRGEAPPAAAQAPSSPAAAPTTPPEPGDGAVVAASIALSDSAAAALPPNGVVFVIARDPAQPVPPIAVSRRMLSELPTVVELGDGESMVAGRSLSGFDEFELEARVSLSGQPGRQPGDWFGSVLVRPAENGSVSLSIDTQVQ